MLMAECLAHYTPIMQAFPSVGSTIAAALSRENLASAEVPRDSCGAQDNDKSNILY
jgi:hypothetical protein